MTALPRHAAPMSEASHIAEAKAQLNPAEGRRFGRHVAQPVQPCQWFDRKWGECGNPAEPGDNVCWEHAGTGRWGQ